MCAEASTVLRAVAADFFFNCWYLEIPSDNRIRHMPRCVHQHAEGFGNVLFQTYFIYELGVFKLAYESDTHCEPTD
jgi:hypothetical protein